MASVTGQERLNQQQTELEKDLEERISANDLPPANIMVAGITGTGKSTLINAVFGEKIAATGTGKPVTEHIDEYESEDIPIHIWDTVGLELNSAKTKESIKSIKETIASKASLEDHYDRIHAIWYCINSGSNRYQDAELDFIKELYSIGVPFIIVLTQCSGDEDEVNAFEDKIRKINSQIGLSDIRIVQVLAMPVKFRGMVNPIPAFGLDNLVDTTLELIPDFIKSSLIAAQRASQGQKRNECEEIICSYVRAAQHGFWEKVPIINVFVTDERILKMFQKIGKMYNTMIPEESIERLINNNRVDFKNNFWGLISPLDLGYSKKITSKLEEKKQEGFAVHIEDVDKDARAARMIAFFGYTFIEAVEKLWIELTEEQLKDVELVCKKLTEYFNDFLIARKEKAKVGE